jgi:hypothetical protein
MAQSHDNRTKKTPHSELNSHTLPDYVFDMDNVYASLFLQVFQKLYTSERLVLYKFYDIFVQVKIKLSNMPGGFT